MKIKRIAVALSCLCIYAMCFAKDVKTQGNNNVKEPYYMIDFSITACNADIKVNDISIFKMEINGQMGTKMPANNAIFKSGQQKFSIELTPLKGENMLHENAEARLAVELVDATNFDTISKESFDVLKSSANRHPVENLYKEFTFNAEVPYAITVLDEAQDLRTIPHLEDKLKKAYMEIHSMMAEKEFSKLESILKAKDAVTAQMLYLSEEESAVRVEEVIADLKNKNTRMNPFPSEVVLTIAAGGKLASLKNKNGDAILAFEDGESETELHFSFYLPKGSDEFAAF